MNILIEYIRSSRSFEFDDGDFRYFIPYDSITKQTVLKDRIIFRSENNLNQRSSQKLVQSQLRFQYLQRLSKLFKFRSNKFEWGLVPEELNSQGDEFILISETILQKIPDDEFLPKI